MAAPGVPSSLSIAHRGFIDHAGGAKRAFRCTWTRSSGPPAPTEHYDVGVTDADDGAPPSPWIDYSTPDAATEQIVDFNDVLSTALDGDETLQVRATNADGSSAFITSANPWAYPTAAAINAPTVAGDLATATTLAAGSITLTSATITWASSAVNTRASHWVIELEHAGSLIGTYQVPFYEFSKTIGGLTAGTGYTYRIFARYRSNGAIVVEGDASSDETFVTDTDAGTVSGPLEISARLGGGVVGAYEASTGSIEAFSLIGGPAGVTITRRDDSFADLGGSPEKEGIFDAIVEAKFNDGGSDMRLYAASVRFLVEGNGFFPWFHDDMQRIDLQIDRRTGIVTSYALSGGITFVRGETYRVYLIFKDGGRISFPEDGFEWISFTARPSDQFDGWPVLTYHTETPDTESLGGYDVPYFVVVADNAIIDQFFAVANAAVGADSASASIALMADIAYTPTGGTRRTTKKFDIAINQDVER